MSSLAILLLLLPSAAEILAAARTKRALRLYFLSQIVSTLATWTGERWFGLSSAPYRLIYVVVTLAILAASFLVAWQAGARWAFLTGAFCGTAGLLFASNALTSLDHWIVALEGALLLMLGATLGLRCHLAQDRRLVALAVLWLLMAVYDFHWLMNPRILVLDLIAPTYLVTAACVYCALHS